MLVGDGQEAWHLLLRTEAFSPRTVLTEIICRCVQHLRQHPVLASFLSGEFLLHIPCWLHFYLASFSYTSHAGVTFLWGVSLTHHVLASLFFFIWVVSLTHPMLDLFLSGEFLLHIPCGIYFYLGSFSYTSHAVFIFIWGVSLTHPMLHFPFCWEYLLHIPCCLLFYNLGSFSYTSRAGFISIWGVCVRHPMLDSFLSGEFLLHIPCWLLFFFLFLFSFF